MLKEGIVLSQTQENFLQRALEMEKSKIKGGANAHEMGMGKTLMSLALISKTWNQRPTVFLVPPTLRKQYLNEIQKFTNFSASSEVEDVGKVDISVLSHFAVLKPSFPIDFEWERIVLDEAHILRNPKSLICITICKMKSNYKWAKSGTFLINRPTDLYAICKFLNFMPLDKETFTGLLEGGLLLKKVIIQSSEDDLAALNLRELKDHKTFVTLDSNEIRQYRRATLAKSSMDVINLQRQICANCLEKQREVRRTVIDILKNRPGEKLIIFTNYIATMKAYMDWFSSVNIPALDYSGKHTMIQRAKRMELFAKSKSYRVMIIGFKCGNAGLNAQFANHVILNEPFWNEALADQAIARCFRKGQTRTVEVYRYIVRDTLEEHIVQVGREKKRENNLALRKKQARIT